MITEFDENENGTIEFSEFIGIIDKQKQKNKDDLDEYLPVFKICDTDGNGSISAEELYQVMRSLGENFTFEEIDDLVKSADVDGNREISYEEFVMIMR